MAEDPRVVDADLVVLGGGPTGHSAAYRVGFRWRTTVITESGSQLSATYPEKPPFRGGGFPFGTWL